MFPITTLHAGATDLLKLVLLKGYYWRGFKEGPSVYLVYTLSIPCVYLVCSEINKVYLLYTYFIRNVYANRHLGIPQIVCHPDPVISKIFDDGNFMISKTQ